LILIARGYRPNEVPLIAPPNELASPNKLGMFPEYAGLKVDHTVKIGKEMRKDNRRRPPVAVSLGPTVKGCCMPIPDLSHGPTALEGALYRFCRDIPYSHKINRKLRRFVTRWVRSNITPLPRDTDLSFKTWLAGAPYTESRKAELIKVYEEYLDTRDIRKLVKSFVKDEHYETYKHARAINSRHDCVKNLVGPIFQAISDALFSLPWFIKKIPLPDRASYIFSRLYVAGRFYLATDYTSFESSFTWEKKRDVERVLYKHMVQNVAERDFFMDLYDHCMNDVNQIEFKWFTMSVLSKRMSGEMDTSLGNGFSNLMFLLYAADRLGWKDLVAVLEGDDSLFSFDTNMTSEEAVAALEKQIKKLGLSIKIESHQSLSTASFCGMVFDLMDKTNVGDPRKILVTFGWSTARYMNARPTIKNMLIRCKALSTAYQYPRCPIVTSMAKAMLRLTSKGDALGFLSKHTAHLDNYKKTLMIDAARADKEGKLLFDQPGLGTRHLVEELYGIDVNTQGILEDYFDNLRDLSEWDHPLLSSLMKPDWRDFSTKYCEHVNPRWNNLDYPSRHNWPKLRPFVSSVH